METKILQETEDAMKKAIEGTRHELAKIRTGKASPGLLDAIRVEVYGSQMPLSQVATVAAPEPRMLLVTPWDKSSVKAEASAIRASELGLNPQDDGAVIRVPIPALNEERRKGLPLLAGHREDGARCARWSKAASPWASSA